MRLAQQYCAAPYNLNVNISPRRDACSQRHSQSPISIAGSEIVVGKCRKWMIRVRKNASTSGFVEKRRICGVDARGCRDLHLSRSELCRRLSSDFCRGDLTDGESRRWHNPPYESTFLVQESQTFVVCYGHEEMPLARTTAFYCTQVSLSKLKCYSSLLRFCRV
jgi:hypothetical protein